MSFLGIPPYAIAMSDYGYGYGYSGYASGSKYDTNNTNMPWFRRAMYMDPEERARYMAKTANARNEVMLENEYNMKKLRLEKEHAFQEETRLEDVKRNRQTNLTRMAANNLQTVLLSGKMDLIKGAWDKYLAELKQMPEILAEANENGELSNKQLAAAAFRYYSLFNVNAEGKPANFAQDAALLPTSLTQGFWNGVTFGLYENENYASIMEYTNGTPQSRADRVKRDLGVAGGTAVASAALGGTGMFVLDNIRNSSLTANLDAIKTYVDKTSAIEALDDIKGVKSLKAQLNAEIAKLDAAIATNEPIGEINKKIDDINNEISKKLKAAQKSAENAVSKAKKALDIAKKAEEVEMKVVEKARINFEAAQENVTSIEKDLAKNLPDAERARLTNKLKSAEAELNDTKLNLSNAENTLASKTAAKEAADTAVTKATENLATTTEKIEKGVAAQTNIKAIQKKAVKAQKSLVRTFGSLGDEAATAIKRSGSVAEQASLLKSARKFKIGGRWGAALAGVIGLGAGIYKACSNDV